MAEKLLRTVHTYCALLLHVHVHWVYEEGGGLWWEGVMGGMHLMASTVPPCSLLPAFDAILASDESACM